MMKRKILIIEDTQSIIEEISDILEIEGYDVVLAKNGFQGLNYIMNNSFDLILCDILMPEIDGFQVLEKLKKDPKTKDIPVIMLTAKAAKKDIEKGLLLGATDYIVKPVSADTLLLSIEEAFNSDNKLKK